MPFHRLLEIRRPLLSLFLVFFALAACSDSPTEPEESLTEELGLVVNSTDVSLSVFDVENPDQVRTVGLGADGSPVSFAVRGGLAIVPLGVVPAAAVVDVALGTVLRTVALPEGSGATGAAFLNDSIALVANPNLNSVSPVNVLRGTTQSPISVGRFPQAIVVAGGQAFVINAELEEFMPAGPTTVSVLDASTLQVVRTVELSGQNGAAASVGPDGLLYVIQSGSFGAGDGSLSVLDPASGAEVDFVPDFGNFPGSVAVDEDRRVYVGAFGVGLLVWDAVTGTFVRGPENPAAPGGVESTSGVALDTRGRLYTLTPDCQEPAVTNRLNADLSLDRTIPVGICPIGIAFTQTPVTP